MLAFPDDRRGTLPHAGPMKHSAQLTRRGLLRTCIVLAGSAGLAGVLGACGGPLAASPAASAVTSPSTAVASATASTAASVATSAAAKAGGLRSEERRVGKE